MDFSLSSETVTSVVLLSVLGSLAYTAREAPKRLWDTLWNQFTVSVVLTNTDPAYDEVLRWLSESGYGSTARHLQLKSYSADYNENVQWVLSPGEGQHFIKRGWKSVLIARSTEANNNTPMSGLPRERLTLRMLGRDQSPIRQLLKEVQISNNADRVVSVYSWRGWWARTMRKRMRPISTVFLKGSVVDSLLSDLKWFEESEDWYAHRGIPYRRGYLLSGPPGTGKTSLVQALAGELGRPVAILNLGSIDGDRALLEAVLSAPKNAFVLLEDVDCAQASGKRKATEDNQNMVAEDQVSLSGLLNALDGVATPDGRVFIMTTNHPERLDAALLRPGRADVRQELGYIGAPEIRNMAERFYGEIPVFSCPPEQVTPAEVQEAFMRHPQDLPAAVQHLEKVSIGPWR